MKILGNNPSNFDLQNLEITTSGTIYYNLEKVELIEHSIKKNQATFATNGALVVNTGEFTGRSPKDRFIVKDEITEKTVWWSNINVSFDSNKFDALYNKMLLFIKDKNLYIKEVYACSDKNFRFNVRLIAELPWSAIFVENMFNNYITNDLKNFTADWTVLCFPSFHANPELDGTRQHNFSIINFTKKIAIIGGSAYTGEIKKGVFSVLNFLLPSKHQILPMHCSVNEGKNGDSAVFFGLSGTGKTTLSTSSDRILIGDDEHAWINNEVFNFEGGCYAKTIDLTPESEPEIYNAIQFGALLENTRFFPNTRNVNYHDSSITLNTRVSYPIQHIPNAKIPSVGGKVENVFFLTCDAFGVLPPISKLNIEQAMYHFISGYTAKIAGTEEGINEPIAVFSACFGEPFLPLHPQKYADLLAQNLAKNHVNVWLINTGWIGGAYGVGSRIKLKYTRAIIKEAIDGKLNNLEYQNFPIFNFQVPIDCPGVPKEILYPKNSWNDPNAFNNQLIDLAKRFIKNFDKFRNDCAPSTLAGEPKIL
jgi:phosphoenolpyruvate carboxykinase (ATP)